MFLFGPVVTIIGLIAAGVTLYDIARHRRVFFDDNITPQDRQRVARLALFVLIPLGVLLHEVGHALAVWQQGAQVLEFNWSYLSGYVAWRGSVTDLGLWWIAFSGNLVSILLGAVGLAVFLLPLPALARYVALTFARFEWFTSLLYYPFLSLAGIHGDWVTIYGVPSWPVRLGIAILHIGLLVAGWQLMRSPRLRRWELTLNRRARQVIEGREAQIAASPGVLRPRLKLAAFYLRRGDAEMADQTVKDALAIDPHNPDALVAAGTLAAITDRLPQAVDLYEQALRRLPSDRRLALVAVRLGQWYIKLGRPQDALAAYSRAIEAGQAGPELYLMRGQAYTALGQASAAQADYRMAALLAEPGASGGCIRLGLAGLGLAGALMARAASREPGVVRG